MNHNSHIWLGWCKSGFPRRGFPQELPPWVKEEASRADTQNTEQPGHPKKWGIKQLPKPGNERQKWQQDNRLLCCDPEHSTGLLQGTPKYIKRIFFLWRMRIKVSKVSSLFYVRKRQSNWKRLKLSIYLCWKLYGYLSFLIMLQKKDGTAIDNIRQQ